MLKDKYGAEIEINGRKAFRKQDGQLIRLSILKFSPNEPAIVTEFAESEEAATINDWDDGNLYFLDFGTEEEMINAIIEEMTE